MAKNPKEKNIYVRSGGASFQVKLYSNGTRISATFDSIEEARTYRDTIRANKTNDRLEQEIKAERVERLTNKNFTLLDALSKFAKEIPDTQASAGEEKYRIGKLKRIPIVKLNFYSIKEADIWDALTEIGGTSENKRHYAVLLRKVFNRSKKWGMKVNNPTADMELPERNPPRERRITLAEYDLLQKHADSNLMQIIDFAIETACRKTEILTAAVSNLDVDGRTLLLSKTKNGSRRMVPLSSKAIRICQEVKSDSRPTIFNMNAAQLRSSFEKLVKTCEIADLHFHDLRHEAISRFFEKRIDGIIIATISGHKDINMLKRYTHLKPYDIAVQLG